MPLLDGMSDWNIIVFLISVDQKGRGSSKVTMALNCNSTYGVTIIDDFHLFLVPNQNCAQSLRRLLITAHKVSSSRTCV